MSDFRVHYDPAVGCYNPGPLSAAWSDEYLAWSYWLNIGVWHELVARFGEADAGLMMSMTRRPMALGELREYYRPELDRRGMAASVSWRWVYEFQGGIRYEVDGQPVFSVTNPVTCWEFDHLLQQEVIIDEVRYKVTGVEFFAHAWPQLAGEKIGLRVKEI